MLGGTETGITVTYQDGSGDIDFVVASQTANDFTNTLKTKLDAIEASADVTDTTNVLSSLIGTELVVKTITAEEYVVSSSVTHMTTSFSSGSTIFGDDILDTHQFTGSLYVSGSLYGDGSNLTGVGGAAGTISGSAQLPAGIISGSTQFDTLNSPIYRFVYRLVCWRW